MRQVEPDERLPKQVRYGRRVQRPARTTLDRVLAVAGLREDACGSRSDAGCGAGDQRHPARQVELHAKPYLVRLYGNDGRKSIVGEQKAVRCLDDA